MAALNEIMARTGLPETEARALLMMAEDRIRLYLAYEEDEDLSKFAPVIADMACVMDEKTKAVKAAQTAWLATAGMESKSYSEGPVSVHETYAGGSASAGSAVAAAYDAQIKDLLQSIARYRRVRVCGI